MTSQDQQCTDDILVEDVEGIRIVTINRPRSRNAINAPAARAIADAMTGLDDDDGLRVGIITGSRGTFCSGMDLKAFRDGELPTVEGKGFGGLVESLPAKPLIAAVEGWALAGGCELALAADLVVASRSALFGLPEVKRGLVAAGGGLVRLPRALPRGVAMRMILTGDPLDASTADRFGLLADLVEDGQSLTAALVLGRAIAANAPLAVLASKRIAIQSLAWSDDDEFAWMHDVCRAVFASDDAREGAVAFAERRKPAWQGR